MVEGFHKGSVVRIGVVGHIPVEEDIVLEADTVLEVELLHREPFDPVDHTA